MKDLEVQRTGTKNGIIGNRILPVIIMFRCDAAFKRGGHICYKHFGALHLLIICLGMMELWNPFSYRGKWWKTERQVTTWRNESFLYRICD
jgi:hypothetical protein